DDDAALEATGELARSKTGVAVEPGDRDGDLDRKACGVDAHRLAGEVAGDRALDLVAGHAPGQGGGFGGRGRKLALDGLGRRLQRLPDLGRGEEQHRRGGDELHSTREMKPLPLRPA